MKIETYIAGPIDANNYLLWDENTKDAILIDCSDYVEDIIKKVKQENLKIKYILLTHGHFDHIMGVNRMKIGLNTKVGLHLNDMVLAENINEFGNLFIGLPEQEIPQIDFNVNNGELLEFANTNIEIIHTPGHTEGSVCYKVNGALFCGDTVFKGSYGRTDLFGGDFSKIKHSIKEILFKLNDNVTLYPGHGEKTTLDYEKKYNDINL